MFTDVGLPDGEENPVSVNLSSCLALREFTTNTSIIERPSSWIETTLSTINLQATLLKRITIDVRGQLPSPDIGDQVRTEAWESVEDILLRIASKFDSDSKFELFFLTNPKYDEGEIKLGMFLERLVKVAVVKFASA